jgi:hypothetical protein
MHGLSSLNWVHPKWRAHEAAAKGRFTLLLQARPIRCLRSLKSSLVIGQNVESGPTPLHLEVGLIWWYAFFDQKMHGLTWPELVKLGAPKVEGQSLALEPI